MMPYYQPLFKTTEESLEVNNILSEWQENTATKRKHTYYTKHEYRLRLKNEIVPGNGSNAHCYCDTGTHIAIYEDMFDIILKAHVGMGHAHMAHNILNEPEMNGLEFLKLTSNLL